MPQKFFILQQQNPSLLQKAIFQHNIAPPPFASIVSVFKPNLAVLDLSNRTMKWPTHSPNSTPLYYHL
jgi:hypothetical protein